MKKDAELLQASWQRAAQGERIEGEMAPLVQTAKLLSSLAETPPPPPNQLLAGRRRFLTEAARVRASKTAHPKRVAWMPARMTFVGALMAVILVFGLVFGIGRAAADSLPGESLYGLKLTIEATRVQWTRNPEAKADLTAALAAERLDEITRLVEQQQAVDEPVANRAKQHLAQALEAVHQVEGQAALQASQRLESTLRVREQAMIQAASTLPQAEQKPVLELLQEIDRVRQELHSGQGEPNGEQRRLRLETPPDPPAAPDPAGQPGPQPEGRPSQPEPAVEPGAGPGPQQDKPAGPEPNNDPDSGAGPWPDERPARPQQQPDKDPGSGPGSQPDDKPAGPQPDPDPGSGPGSQPDQDPGSGSGPPPEEDPGSGSGPGPQTDPDPGSGPGPQPDEDPGSGPGSPQDQDPGSGPGSQSGESPNTPGSPPSAGNGTGNDNGKP